MNGRELSLCLALLLLLFQSAVGQDEAVEMEAAVVEMTTKPVMSVSAEKVEKEAESAAETVPESETAADPDPEAVPAPEPASEPTPEPVPDHEPAAEPAPEPVAEPEPAPESEPAAQPASEPEPLAATAASPESESAAEPVPQPEPASEPEPSTETAPEPAGKPSPSPEPASAHEPGLEPASETAPEPAPQPAPEPEPTATNPANLDYPNDGEAQEAPDNPTQNASSEAPPMPAKLDPAVEGLNCYSCSSYQKGKCDEKPTETMSCPATNKNGCYTLIKHDTKLIMRGCISELTEEGDKYCRKEKKLCKLCYTNSCNMAAAPPLNAGSDRFLNWLLNLIPIVMAIL